MTPKEEEPLGTETPNPSPLAVTLSRPSSPPEGLPVVNVGLDSSNARLDNSSLPLDPISGIGSSADNTRATSLLEETISSHVNPKNDVQTQSISPSKSDKSSTSNNDTSELSSQRSVDSMGSSTDGVNMKEAGDGGRDSSNVLSRCIGPQTIAGEQAEGQPAAEKRNSELVPDLGCGEPSESGTVKEKEEEAQNEIDSTDDVFAVGGAASVFCTCASGHPFVVEPCSVSEMSTSVSSRSDDVEVTFSASSHGVTIADESQRLFDGGTYPLELEPNLHLPNERCNRSLPTEVGAEKVTPPCSNFASYGCEEEYFKNDFVQDLYPILSPQQVPFQVCI